MLRLSAAQGGKKIYHSAPCAKGHSEGRYTSTGTCVVCAREASARYKQRIAEAIAQRRADGAP